MTLTYPETLSADYFGDLYPKILRTLTKRENVLISVIPGFGTKTIYNYLLNLISKNSVFENTVTYDPTLEKTNLQTFVENLSKNKMKNLLIIRFFEIFDNKSEVLEKLDSIKRLEPNALTFLVFTNHTSITHSKSYLANSTTFFTDRLYISPFDKKQSVKMIVTLEQFYGWKMTSTYCNQVYKLSGGIPRLIKYICKEVSEDGTDLTNYQKFLNNIAISFQLELLTKLIIHHSKEELKQLGLMNDDGKIASQLLATYFKSYKDKIVEDLYPNLSDKEVKILSYLLGSDGKIITLDKIADLMKLTDDTFSLWAIYKMISRLKPKVKNNFEIKNIKGRGYQIKRLTN